MPNHPAALNVRIPAARQPGCCLLCSSGFCSACPGWHRRRDVIRCNSCDAFYRAGSLVFGGGHVVLPLLQSAVVPPGWVGQDVFLAGYGATQAMPGPIFTFAAFLGAVGGDAAERMGRRGGGNGVDFLFVIFAGRRAAAVLGRRCATGKVCGRRCAA